MVGMRRFGLILRNGRGLYLQAVDGYKIGRWAVIPTWASVIRFDALLKLLEPPEHILWY